jgi:DNA polymerase-1
MAVIQSKKVAVIQKGTGYAYIPETFMKEHAMKNSYEIEDPQELLQLVKPYEFMGMKLISFDTETHSHFRSSQDVPKAVVRRWVGSGNKAIPQDYPFCLSICDGVNKYSIYDTIGNKFQKFKQLAPLFEDPSIDKIAHNWKFDAHMFANADMRMVGRVHDTVTLTKLVDENRRSFSLRDLAAKKHGGVVKFEYMVDSYKQINKVTDYRQIPRELLTQYANADVWNCFTVFVDEYPVLVADELVSLYNQECEAMVALYAMERYGMRTDSDYKKPLQEDLQVLADAAEREIYEEAGCMFNINSGKQLYEVLLTLGVSNGWIKRTDKGNPKLGKDELNRLAEKYNVSIVKKILEFRKYTKLLNTYAIGIYSQADANDRVHCNINQTQATTGRMSITKPALQTLPKRDKRIRRAFIPEDDFENYYMDLDQVEYRLFAHYAKIPSLIAAIESGHDVHAATAAMIFHIQLDELLKGIHDHDVFETKAREATTDEGQAKYKELAAKLQKYVDMRSDGKTINFALIYGVGIDHLSELLHCSVTEATNLKAVYFMQLPEAKIFIATVYAVIKQRGFVKNFYNRRRRLGSNDCYKAPNALIQGCAADYIKNKLVDMFKYIQYNNLKSRLLLPVHDEIKAMMHKTELEHVEVLRWILSDFASFRCPITAGVEKGSPSWGQKIVVDNIDFVGPTDKGYLSYNVYDGRVFDIYKEA